MGNRQKASFKKELLKEKKKMIQNEKKKEKVELKSEYLAYEDFFRGKNNSKMILYDQFPSVDDMIDYYFHYGWNKEHPIYEYGRFDIRELAVVIQYLYSFYQNREYQLLVFGYLEKQSYQVREGNFEQLKANLAFLVGTDDSLKEFFSWKNAFLGSEQEFDFQQKRESLIGILAKEGMVSDQLGISTDLDKSVMGSGICYYDYLKEETNITRYLSHVNIFDDCFYRKIRNYVGIEDTLCMSIHPRDRLIAKALISIAIFKKNHQKISLTMEDYQYIFDELFHDNSIHVGKEISKNIPKRLRYISRKDG